ncbi:succinate dehydrogenase cytochrome b560 subunit [Gilbertella persicaria]|uniref:Cytochrome b subunit of succinate dehydrogenase, Sdh3p n=1 Tax=Rhizopus stolonifer TaxID=4846 RepID=A0A367IJI0_RHIST|nr:succinate dehydrogenase cytochrome b560 subunit [Gilbertella persicaria]KAI8054977.1 succinate dehydrogenase cytochrome b560 subunit [Gilbertella persicaria]RCH77823.1 cytochrome b subunit of succinate dehydrogenase, Sdh3p [Rhizopus stolonifer]
MLATRSILKTVAQNPAVFRNTMATAPALGVRHFNASRQAKEQCAAAESEMLRQQRKVRPVSPHLTIYQPQITWYLSAAHRITGAALGGGFYLGALAYLAAPAFGYTVDTAAIVSAAASAPVAAKVLAKTTVAAPFVFHSLNGVRHLIWDTCKLIEIKGVYASGYAVLGGTVIGSLYLASL